MTDGKVLKDESSLAENKVSEDGFLVMMLSKAHEVILWILISGSKSLLMLLMAKLISICMQVISGVHKGSSCGNKVIHSGAVANAREALFNGVPSMSISLNWKKDESQESDLKDAASVCLPLITAAISDIGKGNFPKNCSLNVDVPRPLLL